jgi:selenocysteine-specific elongation factor
MRVIGTAGHVDHGKSTLIAALTGTHPDRLKEEQAREMTIDLGFGWLTLPGGEEIGIVDVPGHRDFIGNMLAGIGGIDAALLVIAADEGVMPQTREHLAILDLLQIPGGIVVLTKIDLISDPEWLNLIEQDVRSALRGTVLQDAPCVRVSAKTRSGLDQLLQTLGEILKQKPARLDLGRPRLPVDRVFSMAGFGTVVTGTLSDGHLAVGDEIEILPSGLKGRIRGLQTHRKKEERAVPGSRTAINISGVAVEQIQRGEVIAHPGHYQPARRVDARFKLLPDASDSLQHSSEVKLFIGASETVANLRLLGVEKLEPGGEAWIQLELRDPIVCLRGDRYILRRPSPSETLGGGVIVDPQPKARHKRFDESVLERLESLSHGSPADILLQASLALGAASIKETIARARLESDPAKEALDELIESGQLIPLEEGSLTPASDLLAMAAPQWEALHDQITQTLDAHHKQFPLRRGMPREELKSKLKLAPRLFGATLKKLSAENLIVEGAASVWRAGHEIKFSAGQQKQIDALLKKFAQNPFSPPSVKEAQSEAGDDLVNTLIDLGELIAVSPEVIFRKSDYDQMIARVRAHLQKTGTITVAEARDLFNTSRKYILALLEHLDTTGVTVRDGDYRKLRR